MEHPWLIIVSLVDNEHALYLLPLNTSHCLRTLSAKMPSGLPTGLADLGLQPSKLLAK